MPEYLVLKLEGDNPRDARIVSHVISDAAPETVIKQGFEGDGRYAIVPWDDRVEATLGMGAVKATGVEDGAKRAARAAAADGGKE